MFCKSKEFDPNVYLHDARNCTHDLFEEQLLDFTSLDQNFYTNSKDTKRNVAKWIPKSNIKGIVIIVHGLFDHVLTMSNYAHFLTNEGFAVYGMDFKGHGLSQGKFGQINDYTILGKELQLFSQWVINQENNKSLPLFIHGFSLGTFVTLLSLEGNGIPSVKGIVIIGTPFFPGWAAASPAGIRACYCVAISPCAPCLLCCSSTCLPNAPAGPVAADEIMSNPTELDKTKRDGRRYQYDISNKVGYEVFKMNSHLQKILSTLEVPILIMHGIKDHISTVKGSYFLYENIGTKENAKRLYVYRDAKHALLGESDEIVKSVQDKILGYFQALIDKNTLPVEDSDSICESMNPKSSNKENKVSQTEKA